MLILVVVELKEVDFFDCIYVKGNRGEKETTQRVIRMTLLQVHYYQYIDTDDAVKRLACDGINKVYDLDGGNRKV